MYGYHSHQYQHFAKEINGIALLIVSESCTQNVNTKFQWISMDEQHFMDSIDFGVIFH